MSVPPIREADVGQLINSCLFKYGPLEYLERTLGKQTLGFGSLKSFNDMCEYEFRIAHYFNNREDWHLLMDPPINAISKLEHTIKAYLDEVRVTCFSFSPFINLMWSHYADNHNGVCYCFSKSEVDSLFLSDELESGSVEYSSHVPEVTVFQETTRKSELSALMKKVVLTKSQEWAYENEYRFLGSNIEPAISFDPSKLLAIIIGRRMSDDDIEIVRNNISDFNQRNATNVRMLFSHRRATTFQVGVDSNKGYRNSCETNYNARVPILKNLDNSPITTKHDKDR